MMDKYWKITNKSDIGKIEIFDQIGKDWWTGEGVTAKSFKKDLEAVKNAKTLELYVNSPGGSVFEAQAIYNMLKRHGAENKIAYVEGLAASAASFIIMAMDKVVVPKNSMIMIHKAMTGVYGNYDDLLEVANLLDKVDGLLVDIYVEKTGKTKEEINELMKNETWMTGEEAVEMGFANEVEEEVNIVACASNFDLSNYKNPPKNLKNTPVKTSIAAVVTITEEQQKEIIEKVVEKIKNKDITETDLDLLEENLKLKKNKYRS